MATKKVPVCESTNFFPSSFLWMDPGPEIRDGKKTDLG